MKRKIHSSYICYMGKNQFLLLLKIFLNSAIGWAWDRYGWGDIISIKAILRTLTNTFLKFQFILLLFFFPWTLKPITKKAPHPTGVRAFGQLYLKKNTFLENLVLLNYVTILGKGRFDLRTSREGWEREGCSAHL